MLRVGKLEIDLQGRRVWLAEEPVHLTRTEFNLLEILARHAGQTLSRDQLMGQLHGVSYDGYDRSVDAHVKNLRRKIELDPANPRIILSVYGVGYRFSDEE